MPSSVAALIVPVISVIIPVAAVIVRRPVVSGPIIVAAGKAGTRYGEDR